MLIARNIAGTLTSTCDMRQQHENQKQSPGTRGTKSHASQNKDTGRRQTRSQQGDNRQGTPRDEPSDRSSGQRSGYNDGE